MRNDSFVSRRKALQDEVLEQMEVLAGPPIFRSFRMWRSAYRFNASTSALKRLNWVAWQLGLLSEQEYRKEEEFQV
jgi:hypothetical protein